MKRASKDDAENLRCNPPRRARPNPEVKLVDADEEMDDEPRVKARKAQAKRKDSSDEDDDEDEDEDDAPKSNRRSDARPEPTRQMRTRVQESTVINSASSSRSGSPSASASGDGSASAFASDSDAGSVASAAPENAGSVSGGESGEEDGQESEAESDAPLSGKTLSLGKNSIPRPEVEEADEQRLDSLARYRRVFEPFITKKVLAMLSQTAKTRADRRQAGGGEEVGDAMHTQPYCLAANCLMRNYQIEGFSWLVNNYNRSISCILADEMGLGKTLQSIAFIAHMAVVQKQSGPFLVVVPLSVLFNWMQVPIHYLNPPFLCHTYLLNPLNAY
jgi:SNF2 family DNA or RNA helicase